MTRSKDSGSATASATHSRRAPLPRVAKSRGLESIYAASHAATASNPARVTRSSTKRAAANASVLALTKRHQSHHPATTTPSITDSDLSSLSSSPISSDNEDNQNQQDDDVNDDPDQSELDNPEDDPISSTESDDDDDDDDYYFPTIRQQKQNIKSKSKSNNTYSITRSNKNNKNPLPASSSRRSQKFPTPRLPSVSSLSAPLSPAPSSSRLDHSIPLISPWQSLPYFVLLDIFRYAASSLHTIEKVRWFLSLSRLCRAFAEPVLTALYESPPLLSVSMAHKLVKLLAKPDDDTLFRYRYKIRTLSVDAETIATKQFRGEALDFEGLIRPLRRLQHIDIVHSWDGPPYRQLDARCKTRYPQSLLRALGVLPAPSVDGENQGVAEYATPRPQLRSWSWSSRMIKGVVPLSSLGRIHSRSSLATLTHLTLINFQLPSLDADDPEDPEVEAKDANLVQFLTDAISALSQLQHLSMQSSTAVRGPLLSRLPKTIRRLELVNNWDLLAEEFAEYLVTHGQALEQLTLHHNQSLSLEFLHLLRHACPRLRELRMNLLYYSHSLYVRDSNPEYDQLLDAKHLPTWPSTLEVLEIWNMAKLDEDAASSFFFSLAESADKLLMLREIHIEAALDIPIRQRCKIRDRWTTALRTIYLRDEQDPLPHNTLRPQPKDGAPSKSHSRGKPKAGTAARIEPARRSSRITSSHESRSSKLGLRQIRNPVVSYVDPDTDEDVSDSSSDSDESQHSSPGGDTDKDDRHDEDIFRFLQKKCRVVDIRIDNKRPVENPFKLADFIDDRDTADLSEGDWDGDEFMDEWDPDYV